MMMMMMLMAVVRIKMSDHSSCFDKELAYTNQCSIAE
jgi:hypothetical protein